METILDSSFADVPAGKFAMAVMGQEGDTKYVWDPTNADETEVAKKTFDEFVKVKRYMAFKVKGLKGEKGEQMREFDPEEGRIIFAPQMQGG